ncbi:MAG: pyridoxamine 5'-phosphate oxidase family protein [Pseudomonadota bacterium]
MHTIKDVAELEALYDDIKPLSLGKVASHVTPNYRRWIEASRFVVVATVGPEGTDASPRGDDGPVVSIADHKTLLMPDWRGNNRLDTLRNIVRDPRVSLMFMVPGTNNVVRVNGTADVTTDAGLTARFEKNGKLPRTVVVISMNEIYFQCAKALMRSDLWNVSRDTGAGLPTAGMFLKEASDGFDADEYDAGYPEYAATRMW